jgi:adenylate cyclase class 2
MKTARSGIFPKENTPEPFKKVHIMPIEIELKAWADNPERIQEELSRLAEYSGEFLKEDTYWRPAIANLPERLPPSGVRIRRESRIESGGNESSRILVTFKTKEVREGIEVNREREFEVSDSAPFEELLGLFGLEPASRKRKKGRAWEYRESGGEPGISAELWEVEGLGTFLELEICAAEDSAETVAAARARLFGLLAKTGVGADRIETRYYTEMLQNRV